MKSRISITIDSRLYGSVRKLSGQQNRSVNNQIEYIHTTPSKTVKGLNRADIYDARIRQIPDS